MAPRRTTVVFEDAVVSVAAEPRGEALWIAAGELGRTLGWELRPEGFCRGRVCVPLPAARRAELVRVDGAIDLAALARHCRQVVVHDDVGDVWVFGRTDERDAARPITAPDFALPDLDGRVHRLLDARGRKVLLNSWASW
jgi:hypothetical protein